jgi:hypothetical protein
VRPRLRHAAALGLLGLALAGCGGGGGDSAEAPPPAGTTLPPAMGASPAQSAVQALAALGTPAAVDPAEADETLARLDTFPLPHDIFDAKVKPAAEPETPTVPTVPTAPVVPVTPTVPVVPSAPTVPTAPTATVPTAPTVPTTPTTTTAEVADAPSGAAKQDVVASLAISGEAVLAHAGDAVPPDSQEIVVESIDAGQIVLRLVRGLLPNGSDRVTLRVGQSMTLTDGLLGRTYTIKLLEVLPA